jgi:hypothetical protein
MRRRLHLNCALLFFSASAAAQNQPCEVDVPLNIVMPDAALVRNMPQGGFVAHHGGNVLVIRSVNADTTPRRIVLVVENGNNVNPGARKVEASVLGAIVANARAEDSFAFLTAHGPRKELSIGAPRDALLSAIGELSSPAKGKGQTESTLDAVLEAVSRLQPPQPGDSIILLTMGPKPGEPGYGRVANVLTAAGIRLFGFQLGRVYLGVYTLGIAPISTFSGVLPRATIEPNRETMFALADETGGFFLGENTEGDPQLSYRLTDDRLQQLDKFAGQLYKGIVEYYRIRLVAAPQGFAIDLTDSVRQKLPKAHMAYPRTLLRCSPPSQANPSPPKESPQVPG